MVAPEKVDYRSIRLKVGLEIHQQLSTRCKLFCACPPLTGEGFLQREISGKEQFPIKFRRILRPTTSELGEMDEAARFESRRIIRVLYLADKNSSCLVEADEEPPHPLNEEALDTALIFALALHSRIIEEVHVMRKLVVDGSNTSGFQRTAAIAFGGKLLFGNSNVGVQSISLEEDAARAVKLEQTLGEDLRAYAIDRLGTPLVEVALEPMEGTPRDVEDAARTLGRMMRSTGRIARGLGTIRQDLNISVRGGKVIEVKGVQKLDILGKIVEFEAERQNFFYELAREIKEKVGDKPNISDNDVTDFFAKTQSTIMLRSLKQSNPKIVCLLVKNFRGFFGKENRFGSRLGKELGAIARTYGLGGIIHSDELPGYGITNEEVDSLRSKIGAGSNDAFVLVSGTSDRVGKTINAIVSRIYQSTEGVPAETRSANADGETIFLRPRPGAARMYPETDIPLIQIDNRRIQKLKSLVPEPWEKLVEAFSKKYSLPKQLAEPLFDSERRLIFEDIVASTRLPPNFLASVLVDTLQSLSREGFDIESLDESKIKQLAIALDEGRFAKEALPNLLRSLAKEKELDVDGALKKSGLGVLSDNELKSIVERIVAQNQSVIEERGPAAQSMLMGKIMAEVRGRADGKLVSKTLAEKMTQSMKRKG